MNYFGKNESKQNYIEPEFLIGVEQEDMIRRRLSPSLYYVDSNEIEIKLDNGKYRTITKKYFEKIYNLWDDYIQEKIKRTALSENNLQTTYIISILKKLIPKLIP